MVQRQVKFGRWSIGIWYRGFQGACGLMIKRYPRDWPEEV